ncbi:hypothetical protein [Streptomyces sp. NPDC002685]|uniref:hypothetical protein n=1 Tax=Streptomyces sp. NPDC002685 TaxID=3154540 RepID=UPI00332DD341
MSGEPFSFADCEATFPGCAALVEADVTNAPRFTEEQKLRGKALWATFLVPKARHSQQRRND